MLSTSNTKSRSSLQIFEKKRKIEEIVEKGEGVWFVISVNGLIFIWPGLYENDEKKLLFSEKLSNPAIISMHRLDQFEKEDYKRFIPDDYLEDWEDGTTTAFSHSWKDMLLKVVCDVDGKTTQTKIQNNNLLLAPSLKQKVHSFLAAGLITLSASGIVLDTNTALEPFEEKIKQIVERDKLSSSADVLKNFSQEPIEFCEKFFGDMIDSQTMKPLLSPLYCLSNTHFEGTSEMNYQEILASIFNFIVTLSGGKLLSTGNVKSDALSEQARLARYFAQKYFLPDKIITISNLFDKYNWRCFFGEWKPQAVESVYQHPDFKKIVILMRGALKELLYELLERKMLRKNQELEIFSCLSGGNSICFLRMNTSPIHISKENIDHYYCVYNLCHSKWYDFSTSDGISKIVSVFIQMAKKWLSINFSYQSLSTIVDKIETTPKISKSLSENFANLELDKIIGKCKIFTHIKSKLMLEVKKFRSTDEARVSLSNNLGCNLESSAPVKIKTNRITKNIENKENPLILFPYKSGESDNLCLIERGDKCTLESTLAYLVFYVKKSDGYFYYYRIWFTQRSVDIFPCLRSIIDHDEDDEDDKDDKDPKDDEDNNETNNNTQQRTTSMLENLSLNNPGLENIEVISNTDTCIYGTATFQSKMESFFKITKKDNENVETMKLIEQNDHPNICKILKYHTIGDHYYITIQEKLIDIDKLIEYQQGMTTDDLTKFGKRIIRTVLQGGLKALTCLHDDLKIIHCDISLHNVLFRFKTVEDFEAVIIDFNNSKLKARPQKFLNFKDEYTPTETSLRFTEFHDLYALAVVVNKLMTYFKSVLNYQDEEIKHVKLIIEDIHKYSSALQVLRVLEQMQRC